MRVDHHEDVGTAHEWSLRRGLVAESIRALSADVVALQEPSPMQAADLQADLGPDWGVSVGACDPMAWDAEPELGPGDGQARDGNGFAWRRSRMQLLGSSHFWHNKPAGRAQGMKAARRLRRPTNDNYRTI